MIKLNLETNKKEYKIIKEYLENNVSEELADKINNGVKIVKDNKTSINKKTLDTFMQYANEEARKLAQQGATYACIEDKTVFGWAIHYFEENELEGKLFNEDGTEYKPEIKVTTHSKPTPKPKKENQQASLFELMDLSTNKDENVENIEEKQTQNNDNIIEIDGNLISKETGEILSKSPVNTFDKENAELLASLLENKLTIKE